MLWLHFGMYNKYKAAFTYCLCHSRLPTLSLAIQTNYAGPCFATIARVGNVIYQMPTLEWFKVNAPMAQWFKALL